MSLSGQRGAVIAIVTMVFVLFLLLMTNLGVLAAVKTVSYSPIGSDFFGGGGAGDSGGGEGSGGSDGSYVGGSTGNVWVPCKPQGKRVAMHCGRASAAMVIEALTGEWLNPDTQLNSNWGATLNRKTGLNWRKRNYKADSMAGVVKTIKEGMPVIIYYYSKTMHIVVATQYDQEKDAFLVNNSRPSGCRTEWIKRSYFLSHPYTGANQPYGGYVYRAP